MQQTYNIRKSYEANYHAGPQLNGLSVECPSGSQKSFLSYSVRSRLGVAAGLLLNSKWIRAYSRLGFDLLTYKTVRSSHRPCYPLPNWVFVSDDGRVDGPIYVRDSPPKDPSQVSSAVCFGMPSMAPNVWRKDIEVSRRALQSGQILVVSVVATPEPGWGVEEIGEDYARCALWAKEAGAHVVEANLSCPNVCSAEGSIFRDPTLSQEVTEMIRSRIGNLPLILKIGYFEDESELCAFLSQVAPVADGVTMVNGVTRPVLNRDGSPVFGPQYVQAGVLGRTIHGVSLASVAAAREYIRRQGLGLSILGVGGASSVEDIGDFFQSGADAVMLGSSPMYLPTLARDAKLQSKDW